jgi:hypothetical protein
LAAALSVAAVQAHAQAQTPAAPAQAPAQAPAKGAPAKGSAKGAKPDAGKTLDTITVTGASQQGFRSSIDRRSYGVANDLATTTGSISDALKNVPSVEVDVNGNVSLRGDTNVTIMIDGKPSGLFRGASAAQALQSMPADSVERVEVITNPSAQFSPEGSAGIINLITKHTRKPGKSGSMRINLGTGRRGNAGVSGAYNSNKLTLSGDLSARVDSQDGGPGLDDRTFLDGQGHVLSTSNMVRSQRGDAVLWNARGSADYDIDSATRLSGEARFTRFDIDIAGRQHFEVRDAAGAPTLVFDTPQRFTFARENGAVQGTVRHKFAGDDHELVVNLSRERTNEQPEQALTQILALPAAPNIFTDLHTVNTLDLTQLKADYTRPMPAQAKLKAGYDLRIDDNRYDNVGVRGTSEATAGPDPSQTNLFLYKQTINAAYGRSAGGGRPARPEPGDVQPGAQHPRPRGLPVPAPRLSDLGRSAADPQLLEADPAAQPAGSEPVRGPGRSAEPAGGQSRPAAAGDPLLRGRLSVQGQRDLLPGHRLL